MIFCRNVLIYFDDATKRAVLGRLAAGLASDGYLVLGAAETTTSHSPDFMAVPERHHGVFCFTPEAAAAARAHEEAGRRKGGGVGSPRSEQASAHGPSQADHAQGPSDRTAGVRMVELDGKIADLLEVAARMRGLSLAELLAEFARGQNHVLPHWQGLPAKSSAS